LLGAGTTTGMAMHWPMMAASRAIAFEPSTQDDGYIRLNNNENAYGSSLKVEEVIRSSSVSANRYPFRECRGLLEKIAG
jgi:histidinol-phosphate/aromatic aminotransferase/cobyric acid decarboxylase-like protein